MTQACVVLGGTARARHEGAVIRPVFAHAQPGMAQPVERPRICGSNTAP
ncbi:hypothetical protein ABZY44_33725 [Streptomyces sp. NPDC006544]